MSNCEANSECANTDGNFECACLSGFVKRDRKCVDVNECVDKNNCVNTSDCKNTVGSYFCECKKGYIGKGKEECRGMETDLSVAVWQCVKNLPSLT